MILSETKPKEDFLVTLNGEYSICFKPVEVTGTFEAGTVLENATTAVSGTSPDVLGILAEPVDGTKVVRVMVRGNPSRVNAQALNIGTAVMDDVADMLADKDILVVNR